MARGPIVNYEELKSTIVGVAEKIVKVEGVEALSIRKIAREIGCAVGTIYNAFSSLDEIILSVNVGTMTELQAQLEGDAARETDPFQAALRFARTYVAFSRNNYNLWSMLVEHKLPQEAVLPPWFQQKVDSLFILVSGVVEPLVGGNREEADRAARVLWASLHGVCSLSVSGKLDAVKSETAEVLADSLVRNYLKGLQQNGDK